MKILVAVKRVIDPYVKIAVEEALRIKESGKATEVVVISIGGETCQETLRQALALGACRAILVKTTASHCSLHLAKILEKIVQDEKPDLILMGKQSIDGDNNQTPQMLASLLDWPQATNASKLEFVGDKLLVTREIDGGLETLSLSMPAVVSSDLRLNEPRYASLPNIMKAKQKPLAVVELSSMALELKEHHRVLAVRAPSQRSAGVKLQSVDELIRILRAP